jgi:aspartate aminotransferase
MTPVAHRLAALQASLAPLLEFLNDSEHAGRRGDPTICDFVFGNPHEMPLAGLVESVQRHVVPANKDWFAYTVKEPSAATAVATSLVSRTGLSFVPDDIHFVPGAFGGLAVALRATVDPGDEVIFLSPPWFFYESMIAVTGAVPVRATLEAPHFGLDAALIASAITPRTRAIIVNSPHNPTGRVYTRQELEGLARTLRRASAQHGRPILLFSDESYNRILFDGRHSVSPAAVYDDTLVIYTYGKQLLAPGERVGYLAASPLISAREELRAAILFAQIVGGWQMPSSTLQRTVPDLERLSIDIGALERRRNRLAAALQELGYETAIPEGTFYMMVRSPIPDDRAFTTVLAKQDVFVGPGVIFELPGYFRISLTANDDMVTRSIRGFAAARAEALGR